MQLLFNHVSRFAYAVTERTDIGGELDEADRTGETGEAMLVKVCTESGDAESTVESAAEEVRAVAGQVGVETLVVLPWAHLSGDLAAPDPARARLEALNGTLEAAGYEVVAVPFGWYKTWELESKGHPMSVLSRSV